MGQLFIIYCPRRQDFKINFTYTKPAQHERSLISAHFRQRDEYAVSTFEWVVVLLVDLVVTSYTPSVDVRGCLSGRVRSWAGTMLIGIREALHVLFMRVTWHELSHATAIIVSSSLFLTLDGCLTTVYHLNIVLSILFFSFSGNVQLINV